jgi:hypothetical protein
VTFDPAIQKKRFTIMVTVDVIAVLVALAAAVAWVKLAFEPGFPVMMGAIVIGIIAQIWFVLGVRMPGKGA